MRMEPRMTSPHNNSTHMSARGTRWLRGGYVLCVFMPLVFAVQGAISAVIAIGWWFYYDQPDFYFRDLTVTSAIEHVAIQSTFYFCIGIPAAGCAYVFQRACGRQVKPFTFFLSAVVLAMIVFGVIHCAEIANERWYVSPLLSTGIVTLSTLAASAVLTVRSHRGGCPKCGYDLRGDLDSGCPECGWNRGS